TEAWEQVYGLGMGPWRHIPAGFEVCQAAKTPKSQHENRKQGVAVEVDVDVGSQVVFPGVAVEIEVDIGSQVVFPVPLGIDVEF
ncbi:hypothetical protein THAOC_33535, partial [Thalassiosira oceanica]